MLAALVSRRRGLGRPQQTPLSSEQMQVAQEQKQKLELVQELLPLELKMQLELKMEPELAS